MLSLDPGLENSTDYSNLMLQHSHTTSLLIHFNISFNISHDMDPGELEHPSCVARYLDQQNHRKRMKFSLRTFSSPLFVELLLRFAILTVFMCVCVCVCVCVQWVGWGRDPGM